MIVLAPPLPISPTEQGCSSIMSATQMLLSATRRHLLTSPTNLPLEVLMNGMLAPVLLSLGVLLTSTTPGRPGFRLVINLARRRFPNELLVRRSSDGGHLTSTSLFLQTKKTLATNHNNRNSRHHQSARYYPGLFKTCVVTSFSGKKMTTKSVPATYKVLMSTDASFTPHTV